MGKIFDGQSATWSILWLIVPDIDVEDTTNSGTRYTFSMTVDEVSEFKECARVFKQTVEKEIYDRNGLELNIELTTRVSRYPLKNLNFTNDGVAVKADPMKEDFDELMDIYAPHDGKSYDSVLIVLNYDRSLMPDIPMGLHWLESILSLLPKFDVSNVGVTLPVHEWCHQMAHIVSMADIDIKCREVVSPDYLGSTHPKLCEFYDKKYPGVAGEDLLRLFYFDILSGTLDSATAKLANLTVGLDKIDYWDARPTAMRPNVLFSYSYNGTPYTETTCQMKSWVGADSKIEIQYNYSVELDPKIKQSPICIENIGGPKPPKFISAATLNLTGGKSASLDLASIWGEPVPPGEYEIRSNGRVFKTTGKNGAWKPCFNVRFQVISPIESDERNKLMSEAVTGGSYILKCNFDGIDMPVIRREIKAVGAFILDLNGHCLYVNVHEKNANGIRLENNADMSITDSTGNGLLTVRAHCESPDDKYGAAINTACGRLQIYGGEVNVTGAKFAAGIGGGSKQACGDIIINGGTVLAYGGRNAAGIGSGDEANPRDDLESSISIKGGEVYAVGGYYGAGIGTGYYFCCGCIISIYGGEITAIGGNRASGIGAGTAKIGQKIGSIFLKISATDGIVKSYGGEGGMGIGGYADFRSRLEIYEGLIYAEGGMDAAGIGSGKSSAGDSEWYTKTETIIDSATVTAIGNGIARDIGSSDKDKKDDVIITGGSINAVRGKTDIMLNTLYPASIRVSDARTKALLNDAEVRHQDCTTKTGINYPPDKSAGTAHLWLPVNTETAVTVSRNGEVTTLYIDSTGCYDVELFKQ